jgi:hypothetical protein
MPWIAAEPQSLPNRVALLTQWESEWERGGDVVIGAFLILVAALLQWIASTRGSRAEGSLDVSPSEERRKQLVQHLGPVAVLVVVATGYIVILLALPADRDSSLVASYQTTAAERRLLLAMDNAGGGCATSGCDAVNAPWMDENQDDLHFSHIGFVDGDTASGPDNGPSISVVGTPGSSPLETGTVGMAFMAPSGVCVEMVGFGTNVTSARYAIAPSQEKCTGADALSRARETSQECGGWTVMRSDSEFWPVAALGAGTASVYGPGSVTPSRCSSVSG